MDEKTKVLWNFAEIRDKKPWWQMMTQTNIEVRNWFDFNVEMDIRPPKATWEDALYLPNDSGLIRDGWFDEDFLITYREIIKEAKDGARFVEIGPYLGRSTVFMADRIRRSGKNIKFFSVDNFRGTPSAGDDKLRPDYKKFFIEYGGKDISTFYYEFLSGIAYSDLMDYVTPLVCSSLCASTFFRPKSLDFIFIDGDHDFDMIFADILAWVPKIKPGGIIAGHDYEGGSYHGVRQVVDSCFGSKVRDRKSVWVVRL